METVIDATPPKDSDPAGDNLSTTTTSNEHPLSLWIWKYGTLILENENKYWACNLCPNKSNPQWYQISSWTRAAATYLSQMAVDILSIPAMSAEVEDSFQSAK